MRQGHLNLVPRNPPVPTESRTRHDGDDMYFLHEFPHKFVLRGRILERYLLKPSSSVLRESKNSLSLMTSTRDISNGPGIPHLMVFNLPMREFLLLLSEASPILPHLWFLLPQMLQSVALDETRAVLLGPRSHHGWGLGSRCPQSGGSLRG